MQTASGYVVLSPENRQFHRGITPAAALILRKLHYKNSQGNPLEELVIDGEATETGPDGTVRLRTNGEEIARLKKHFTGVINGVRAFEAVFGGATMLRLPETFEEIAEELGGVMIAARAVAAPAGDVEPHEWNKEMDEELVNLETVFKPTKEQKHRLAELRQYKASASNLKR